MSTGQAYIPRRVIIFALFSRAAIDSLYLAQLRCISVASNVIQTVLEISLVLLDSATL